MPAVPRRSREASPVDEITLHVRRTDPATGASAHLQTFRVPVAPGDTVLAALLYIYDHLDSTLAFAFSCRSRRCGLCSMMVNGRAVLACSTPARDGQVVEPLAHLPVVRDLVVDRGVALDRLQALPALTPADPVAPPAALPVFPEVPAHRLLTACNDCLACVAHCPEVAPAGGFPGPLFFGKLAALHLDPGDGADRPGQAAALGIGACSACPGCKCPVGVPVWKFGVRLLLGARKE